MPLQSLYLKNFRNYKEAGVVFSPELNFIYGDNGQGKTNLLEAVCFLLTGRSFRTRKINNLIHVKESNFYIEARFASSGIDQLLKIQCNGSNLNIVHNATKLPSLSALLGILQGVIIAPDDYELVKGAPILRRQFLDMHNSCSNPIYLYYLKRYAHAIKQRNCLLRWRQLSAIEIWEDQMADSAAYLTLQRRSTINTLNKNTYIRNAPDALSLNYQTTAPLQDNLEILKTHFLDQYRKNRHKEVEIGNTIVGPHRDDMILCVQGNDIRHFASEGQARSCSTALRMAQWSCLKHLTKEFPILGIDDVGISLDASRQLALYSQLTQCGQVFLTSTQLPNTLPQSAHCIHVCKGSFS